MKIALIAPTRIPARTANSLQVMKMAQALVQSGHAIRLAAPRIASEDSAGTPGWQELSRQYGLSESFPIDWLPAATWGRGYDYALRSLFWARGWGAEFCYTRLPQAAALASLTGFHTIFEVHDLPSGRWGPTVYRAFLRGRGARRLVVITQALAKDLAVRLGAPLSPPLTLIAPDGVDLERFRDLPEPALARQDLLSAGLLGPGQLPAGRFTAGYTGHLYPGRGTGLLLDMAACLPQVTFLVVGGEPQAVAQLRAQAQDRQLTNLLATGFVPNQDLPRYQAACDVLLMPYQDRVAASSGGDISRYLSPMKVFEYLACGRPILSSDLPVLREVLDERNAIMLPPDQVEAWAQALRDLQTHPQYRELLGEQARQTARRYSWQARAERILEGLQPGTVLERSHADAHID